MAKNKHLMQGICRGNPQKTLLSSAIAAVIGTAVAAPAVSQELEEIIVTVTKRAESVQDVPLAVTAFGGDFTKDVNLNDVKDLVMLTPGVSGNSQDSFIDAISVRGIRTQDFGVGGDPSAAFFKNDLYEGRNGSAVTSLYDMERSEVLRGPQGFLFGRNSIAGAFSVHTRKADLNGGNSGYIDVDIAERGRRAFEGAINVPVSDNFAMRFAGYHSTEDGFAFNNFDGSDLIEHDKSALRWSTTYEDDALTVQSMVEYETREQSGSVYRAIERGAAWEALTDALGPITLRGNDEQVDVDRTLGDSDDADILTLGLKIEYDLGWATLTSNTGYKDHDYFYTEDYDGTPLQLNDYRQDQKGDYFQQEFRITSDTDSDLSWYAGVSYYEEEIDTTFSNASSEELMCQYYSFAYYGTAYDCVDYITGFTPSPDGTLLETGRAIGDYKGWATYVDLTYAFTDEWDASLGLRYSKDKKSFSNDVPTPDSDLGAFFFYGFSTDGPVTRSEDWSELTSRVVVRYRPNDTAMFFASYTEGFKSGGFGTFNLDNNALGDPALGNEGLTQADGFLPNVFNPETIDSIEFGYKDTLFDGQANVSLTAFFYEYQDLQVVVSTDGGASVVQNVGEADGHGLEGSIQAALGDNWTLYFGAGWLDTEATNLQDICALADANGCEGSPLYWAPEYTAAMVLNAHYPVGNGEVIGSFEVSWESERGGGWEQLDETMIDSSAEASMRFGYQSDNGWNVTMYIENLTNEFTWDGQNNQGGILPDHFFGPRRPRTVGINFGYEWE